MLPTKMADRKTVVLKYRLDPTQIETLGEKLKGEIFTKFRFLKPKPGDVQIFSIDKYYEPFIVIGGRYAIDYCKSRLLTLKVDGDAVEVALFDRKIEPEPSNNPSSKHKVIKLNCEEYFHYENKAYFILDKTGREIDPEQLTYAPSEERPVEGLPEVGISREEKIMFLQSRIAKKPPDLGEVIKEIFEVNERDIVYRPTYKLTFQNVKTGKEVTAKIDGVTGKVLVDKAKKAIPSRPEEVCGEPTEKKLVAGEQKLLEPLPTMAKYGDAKETIKDYCFVVGDVEIPSETAMNETILVKGSLKIGPDCRILGKVKALKDIIIGANTTIEGKVVSGQNILIGPNSFIYGSVESAGDIEIRENVVIEGGLHSRSPAVLNQFAEIRLTEKP